MANFGSAMNMSPELRAAIQARSGQQNPQGSQISGGTPQGPGNIPPAPQAGGMLPRPPQSMPSPQGMAGPATPPPTESELIIKALSQRLSSLSKQQEPPKPPQMGGMR